LNDPVKLEMLEGMYIISDPCYIIPDQYWTEFCDTLEMSERVDEMTEGKFRKRMYSFLFKGHRMYVSGTAYGDGGYLGKKNGDDIDTIFGVDAGLLAAIPVKFVHEFGKEHENEGYYTMISGGDAYYEDGDVVFGDVVIETDCIEGYEDEEEEEEDEDDE